MIQTLKIPFYQLTTRTTKIDSESESARLDGVPGIYLNEEVPLIDLNNINSLLFCNTLLSTLSIGFLSSLILNFLWACFWA